MHLKHRGCFQSKFAFLNKLGAEPRFDMNTKFVPYEIYYNSYVDDFDMQYFKITFLKQSK
jgi:hypothetical protein